VQIRHAYRHPTHFPNLRVGLIVVSGNLIGIIKHHNVESWIVRRLRVISRRTVVVLSWWCRVRIDEQKVTRNSSRSQTQYVSTYPTPGRPMSRSDCFLCGSSYSASRPDRVNVAQPPVVSDLRSLPSMISGSVLPFTVAIGCANCCAVVLAAPSSCGVLIVSTTMTWGDDSACPPASNALSQSQGGADCRLRQSHRYCQTPRRTLRVGSLEGCSRRTVVILSA
jgi:hypothetical protein